MVSTEERQQKNIAKKEAKREMMLNGNLLKVIPILAIPMVITTLIDSLYNLADTFFVSQLGIYATAAVGVNDSLLHVLRSIAMGFGVGASSYISRLLGAKKDEEAHKVAATTLFTAIIFMSFVAVITFVIREPFVDLLGATEMSHSLAVDYATFILFSAPLTAGEVCCSQLLRSEGNTLYSMIGMVSGCVINCALDPIFINKLQMGVGGAALATTISKAISFSILLVPFLRKRTIIELKFKNFKPSKQIYKEVARMGIPTFLRMGTMTFGSIVRNNVAGSFSDAALAASSVSNKSTKFMSSAILGFGQGFQPLAGFCYGAKKYKRVRDGFWTCTAIGVVCCTIIGIVMAIFAPELILIFATEPKTVSLGTIMIRTQCATMIFHCWIMIVNGFFTALGKSVYATIMGLSRQVLCLIPSILVLAYFFGEMGLAHSQAATDILAVCIAIPMVAKIMKELKQKELE